MEQKIGKKIFEKRWILFVNMSQYEKNPPKIENDFKWSTATVKEKIIYRKVDRLDI